AAEQTGEPAIIAVSEMDMHDVGAAAAKQADEDNQPPGVVDRPAEKLAAGPQGKAEPEFSGKIAVEARHELGHAFDPAGARGLGDQVDPVPHLGEAAGAGGDMRAVGSSDQAKRQTPLPTS